ncbi:hypothetical protein CQW23_21742 [Capsicum baccatum]|uniref:C2 domain-containing protein n=1 Tax=Capsicum baccatum TaxID=33114 RepID=A0A2G2VYZ5_CAPBA|nr:hypothetical protein CQW23_21742 [Capsicum baccatum]
MMDLSRRNFYNNTITSHRDHYNFNHDNNNNNNLEEVYVMKLFIKKASNIIRFNDTFPYSFERAIYRVIVSDEKGREFSTTRRMGTPTPEWNEHIEISFESEPINQELTLMVIRENCYDDPGTSTGEKVVGRAIIPVPELNVRPKKDSVVELVKLVGVDEKRVEADISFLTLLNRVLIETN